jgi:hypothetical protein
VKNRKGAGLVSPADMEVLQVCFDALLAQNRIDRDSSEADMLASALFTGHRQGTTSLEELRDFAEIAIGLRKKRQR